MKEIEFIKKRLAAQLPGLKAHQSMFPSSTRPKIDEQQIKKFRKSAVALILFYENHTLKSILTKRNVYEGVHSDQISLPGGKFEKDKDHSLIDTALRESNEEIGVDTDHLIFLGKLSTVSIPVSRFLVHPHVFFFPAEDKMKLEAHPYEVKEIITFTINTLLNDKNKARKPVKTSTGRLDVPCFVINEHTVWGATSLILNEFKEILKPIEE